MIRRSCVLLLLLAVPLLAQLPPEKAESSFTVSDGLEFKLWASEPLFTNPTCMDVDHRGRVWVVESVNYRNKLRNFKKLTRPEGDRIVILEDVKGEGKATKATTFYQAPEIMAPLGIAVAKDPVGPGYRVFVCQSPDILVFTDKDGDGKADGRPTKLLTGFRGIDHDHGVHSILVGPDFKLYFTVGDAGVGGLQSSDGKGRKWTSNSTDARAGTVWRCELDGTKLELVAHNFRNNYEVGVDSFGTLFLSDNDDDGNQQTRICHVIPGGNYGYHPRGKGQTHWHEEQPGVMPKVLRTYFGSPTGICMYEGTLLPKKYHGQLLHCDAGPRHVRAYHLTAKGASYEAEQENIVQSKDNWFRPSDVCVAPDGSVFVADWYDPGVGGHGMGDIKQGRVFRLAPKGAARKTIPDLDLTTDGGVLIALASPNLATRYMAMARLNRLPRLDAVKLLEPAVNDTDNPIIRARAIWQTVRVQSKGGFLSPTIFRATGDPDPRFQALGVRALADFHPNERERPEAIAQMCRGMLKTKAGTSVLRECLVALRTVEPEVAKPLIYEMMKHYDGKDRHYLACVGIAVGGDPERRKEILADFGKHFAKFDEKVAGLVFELRPPGMAALLQKRLTDVKVPEAERAAIADVLAGSDEADAATTLIKALKDCPPKVRERILTNLRVHLPGKWAAHATNKAMTAAIDDLLGAAATRAAGLELIGVAGRNDLTEKVVAAVKDQAVRPVALAALAQLTGNDAAKALLDLAAKDDDAVAALGERMRTAGPKDAATAKALELLEAALKADRPARCEAAAAALAASRPGTQKLLALHAAGSLPTPLLPVVGRLLRNSPYPDLQNKALIAFPAPGKMDLKKLPPIKELAARKGSVERGKKLFEASLKSNLGCLKCHMVRGAGGQIGPDLSMIGKKASRENLIESILYPSKAIADQYLTWVITNRRGVVMQGLLVEDTEAGVVIRDAEGRDTRVGIKQIEKREKGMKSLMPEDVVALLSPEELVDLVEYMATLKTASLTIGSWRIVGPFDNGAGMDGLDREFPPEKAIDLKAEYDGKGGKVKWTTVRAGAGGYVDLKAHYGDRSGQTVSYLTAEVESPADQEAELLIGSDDGAKVWVGGKLVHTSKLTRAAAPEQDRVKVALKKGANRIVVKINNGDGPHGLYLTLRSEQELKAAR